MLQCMTMLIVDDGYRLSYSGYDYLALKALVKKGIVYAVGPQVGTGKESDVFTCTGDDETGKQLILKIHR
jgi:RIO kinase 2